MNILICADHKFLRNNLLHFDQIIFDNILEIDDVSIKSKCTENENVENLLVVTSEDSTPQYIWNLAYQMKHEYLSDNVGCVFSPITMDSVTAVFALKELSPNAYAATTRDDNIYKYGHPGGKIDEGENYEDALIRECEEEGWEIHQSNSLSSYVCWVDVVMGKYITAWVGFSNYMTILTDYKEKGRISPVIIPDFDLINHRYKSDLATSSYDTIKLFLR